MDRDVRSQLIDLCRQHGLAPLTKAAAAVVRARLVKEAGRWDSLARLGGRLLPGLGGAAAGGALGGIAGASTDTGLGGTLGGALGGAIGGGALGMGAGRYLGRSGPRAPLWPGTPAGAVPAAGRSLLGRGMDSARQGLYGALPMFTRPAAAGGRELSLGRTAGTLGGAVGVGTLGAYGMGDAHYTAGRTANPFTWLQPNSWETAARRNTSRLREMQPDMERQITRAEGRNTPEGDVEARQLRERLDTGNYGGDHPLWQMGGWNPLARRNASHFQDRALGIQQEQQSRAEALDRRGPNSGDQARLDRITQRLRSGNILPHQEASLQRELETIRQRMQQPPGATTQSDAIRAAMRGAGLNARDFQPRGPGSGLPNPAGHWPIGRRSGYDPNQAQFYALNPPDFAPDPSLVHNPYVMPQHPSMQYGLPTGPAGPVTRGGW